MEEAIQLGAKLSLGCTVTSLDFDKTEVLCANGSIAQGDVVIGADGLPPHASQAALLAFRVVV